ncbi:MAG: DUF3137 domain-containing protein [Erysipelothrix sp.]|nr:DUF3137 domain-containing protein [Erysipelothrix sp.]
MTETEQKIEALRLHTASQEKKNLITIALIVIAFLIPLGFLSFLKVIAIGYLIYLSVQIYKSRKHYANGVKKIISEDVFSKVFDRHVFKPEGEYNTKTLRDLDIITVGTATSSNDILEGTFHGIDFKRADVTSTTTVSTGKSTVTITNFRGQIYEFDFFKNSKSYIRIRTKQFLGMGKGRKTESSRYITFDDQEFNDQFHCFSNNDHEAFYIFTPHFMNKIKELRNKVDGEFTLVIYNSRLYISIFNNTDSFEPKVSETSNRSYLYSVKRDINIISTIIDDLDLKNTLFK